MSLLNLSRYTMQAERPPKQTISTEAFINQALEYAEGKTKDAPQIADKKESYNGQMRRATFTLTEACIKQLQQLSLQSGLPKSKLIRLWIGHYSSMEQE